MRSRQALSTALMVGILLFQVAALLARGPLQPCPSDDLDADALCGVIPVYEDRAAMKGRTLGLNIVLLPATGAATQEPLFLLAGGPGQGATDLAQIALRPFAPIRKHRDMVLVDQRGTGASARLDCPVDGAESPQTLFGNLFDPEMMGRCLEHLKQNADPRLYTTDPVVDDLDEVRQVLGYEKVFLWGGSGGTRTALVWMRRHPERVVAAVLDGVAPTDFRAPSTMARGCQDTLEAIFEECRQQDECHAAFPSLAADFDKVLGLFEGGPVQTHIVDHRGWKIPVGMHRGDFAYAVRGLLYRGRSLAMVPAMIHRAAVTEDIQPFAQAYWQRQVGTRPSVSMGVHFGIYCSEDLPFIDEKEVAGFTDNTFVGRYLYDQYKGICDLWEARPVDPSFLLPIHSEIPVLILSGYYDPSTPIRMGERVASHLPNSLHVAVRNESHGAEFGCARPAVIQFMKSGSLAGLGPICEDVGPVRYEVTSP